MRKKYIVRLTDAERATLDAVIRRQTGSASTVRRAHVLLKADADGPNWTDAAIADAFGCRRQTVENVRARLATDGFDAALNGRLAGRRPRSKVLSGEQEATVMAMRLGPPPAGFAGWSLRLLTARVVELAVVPTVSVETVRRTLKKTACRRG